MVSLLNSPRHQRSIFLLAITAFLLIIAGHLSAEEPFQFDRTPGKLPKSIVPLTYVVEMIPEISTSSFRGVVRVTLNFRQADSQIVLNALGLTITKALFDGDPQAVGTPQLNPEQQTLTLPLRQPPALGRHELLLEFTGKLEEKPQGLYLVRYEKSNEERIGLATQFEATDARRMFPCWDEPAFRATFSLSVTLPESMVVISNQPVKKTKREPSGKKTVLFEKTPPMPTYLLALFAGDWEKIEDQSAGVQLRIYTTPGKKTAGRYALEVTKEVLEDFAEYFGTKYPLPKLDQIALPNTGAGGMENWGCIVYKEDALLFDPATSSQSQRERVYGIVAHEIAHQWFGNLVTMAWWDNLWLNEGFASWLATKQIARRHPEWKPWLRATSGQESAMRLDARSTTHPIQQVIRSESEAGDAFDVITYQKGQAVIRMLEEWLGEDSFRTGIQRYIKAHAFSNTTTADLWNALAKASGKDVLTFAKGWTEQPGFPLVQSTLNPATSPPTITCNQVRFTIQQKNPPPLFWKIPIRYGPAGNPQLATWQVIDLENPLLLPFIDATTKLNIGGGGYFRIQYEKPLFEKLLHTLPHLAEADRLNLLYDTWALAQADRQPITDYLDLVEKLAPHPSPTELEQILGAFGQIDRMMGTENRLKSYPASPNPPPSISPDQQRFREWALTYLRPTMLSLGWNPADHEPPLLSQLRPRILSLAGTFADPATLKIAHSRFTEFLQNPSAIDPNLRSTVLNLIGRTANDETWTRFHQLALKTTSAEHRREFYNALASAHDPALAAKTLTLALGSELPPHDAAGLVSRVAIAGEQPHQALSFAQKNLRPLLSKLAAHQANDYLPNLWSTLPATAELAEELEAWAIKNLPETASPNVAKVADEIRFQASFRIRTLPDIHRWISRQTSPALPKEN